MTRCVKPFSNFPSSPPASETREARIIISRVREGGEFEILATSLVMITSVEFFFFFFIEGDFNHAKLEISITNNRRQVPNIKHTKISLDLDRGVKWRHVFTKGLFKKVRG